MEPTNQRMRILEMIDEGRITADEGLNLLQNLSEPLDEPEAPVLPQQPAADTTTTTLSQASTSQTGPAADINKWKRWWMIPLWIGFAVTIFGGLFMFQAQQSSGLGFWFFCASVPFILGLVLMALAWQSRTAPWLHLRVRQRPGEKPERIAFSLPLPLRQAGWLLRVFGRRHIGRQNQDWEQMLQAVGKNASPENPIYIQVDEAESGEKVEIYLG